LQPASRKRDLVPVLDGHRYVVVCRGPHCRERGALPLRQRLVSLLRQEPTTHVLGYHCFGQCDDGPNVAFYPDAEWYGGLAQSQDAERVVRHAIGTEPLAQKPLVLPEPERGQHLANIAELVLIAERDRARPRRWWWPF
jgi:(2Fe-2S) ferredoxin